VWRLRALNGSGWHFAAALLWSDLTLLSRRTSAIYCAIFHWRRFAISGIKMLTPSTRSSGLALPFLREMSSLQVRAGSIGSLDTRSSVGSGRRFRAHVSRQRFSPFSIAPRVQWLGRIKGSATGVRPLLRRNPNQIPSFPEPPPPDPLKPRPSERIRSKHLTRRVRPLPLLRTIIAARGGVALSIPACVRQADG
jgi:hypothetical protein